MTTRANDNYTIPASIDQKLEDLLNEELRSAELSAKGYLDLYLDSQAKIERINAALKNLLN